MPPKPPLLLPPLLPPLLLPQPLSTSHLNFSAWVGWNGQTNPHMLDLKTETAAVPAPLDSPVMSDLVLVSRALPFAFTITSIAWGRRGGERRERERERERDGEKAPRLNGRIASYLHGPVDERLHKVEAVPLPPSPPLAAVACPEGPDEGDRGVSSPPAQSGHPVPGLAVDRAALPVHDAVDAPQGAVDQRLHEVKVAVQGAASNEKKISFFLNGRFQYRV